MIKWIANHKIIAIITSLVLVLCIIISVSYFKGTGFIGDLIQRGGAAVSEPVTDVTDGAERGIKGLLSFRKTMRENEALRDEIERLEAEIVALRLQENELAELRELSGALNYVSGADAGTHVTAKVIATDNSSIFNIFTINAGTEAGITEECVVVAANGLVGRVLETGNGYSKVISIVDEDVNISFQVLRDMNTLGVVSGDGTGGLAGYTLEADAGIVEGDVLITTGIGMYPEGIEIGKVTKVEFNSDIQLLTILADPAMNFKNLRKVTVLL